MSLGKELRRLVDFGEIDAAEKYLSDHVARYTSHFKEMAKEGHTRCTVSFPSSEICEISKSKDIWQKVCKRVGAECEIDIVFDDISMASADYIAFNFSWREESSPAGAREETRKKDYEMSDSETFRALESCAHSRCDTCPLRNYHDCRQNLAFAALSTINHLNESAKELAVEHLAKEANFLALFEKEREVLLASITELLNNEKDTFPKTMPVIPQ